MRFDTEESPTDESVEVPPNCKEAVKWDFLFLEYSQRFWDFASGKEDAWDHLSVSPSETAVFLELLFAWAKNWNCEIICILKTNLCCKQLLWAPIV